MLLVMISCHGGFKHLRISPLISGDLGLASELAKVHRRRSECTLNELSGSEVHKQEVCTRCSTLLKGRLQKMEGFGEGKALLWLPAPFALPTRHGTVSLTIGLDSQRLRVLSTLVQSSL